MTVLRTGSTPKYADGWDTIFANKKSKKSTAGKKQAKKKSSSTKAKQKAKSKKKGKK